jgi:hypothetical protein
LTVFFAEEGFQPYKLDMALVGQVGYWYDIAEQAVDFFSTKEPFMNWVCRRYPEDTHRFTASLCWDIAILEEVEGDREEDV